MMQRKKEIDEICKWYEESCKEFIVIAPQKEADIPLLTSFAVGKHIIDVYHDPECSVYTLYLRNTGKLYNIASNAAELKEKLEKLTIEISSLQDIK